MHAPNEAAKQLHLGDVDAIAVVASGRPWLKHLVGSVDPKTFKVF